MGGRLARLVTVGTATVAVAVAGLSVWWSIQPATPSPLSDAQLTPPSVDLRIPWLPIEKEP